MASPGSVVIQFLVDAKDAAKDAAALAKNFGKVDKEADGLDSTLSGLESELDSIGRETAALKADMGKAGVGFDGVGDDAADAADKVRRAARDMADGVRQGARGVDRETDKIKTDMSDTGREAGAEFIGNVAEGIGSGSGSVTDVVQGTLGGLTNLAASIAGPVGIAAGAAAAGVGLVFAAVTAEAEKSKERVKEVTRALVELGETSSAAAKQVLWDEWRSTLDDGGKTIGQIAEGLRLAGVKQGVFQDAITGSAAAQKEVRDKVAEQIQKIEDLKKKQGGLGVLDAQRLAALKKVNTALGEGEEIIAGANQELTDTELLTGDAERAAKDWTAEMVRTYNQAHNIKNELNKIPSNIPVNVIVTTKDKNGRPVKLGPGQLSAPAPAAVGRAAQPVTVNVYADTGSVPRNPRQVVALLESHSLRMGRKPGQSRAVAW